MAWAPAWRASLHRLRLMQRTCAERNDLLTLWFVKLRRKQPPRVEAILKNRVLEDRGRIFEESQEVSLADVDRP